MNTLNKILILGSGQAAIYAASEIRKYDKGSEISIFGNENYHPYERPPLSKEFLMGKKKEEEFLFFSKNFFADQNIYHINKEINEEVLLESGLVTRKHAGVRVLAKGSLTAKVTIKVTGASKSAMLEVEKHGGSCLIS